MDRKAVCLLATVALSGCAQPSTVVQVSNLSAAPVEVTYLEKGASAPQTLRVAAGEVRSLGNVDDLRNYVSVEFRSRDKSAIFRDASPAAWRDSDCASDCGFVWYGDGRVTITA